MIGMNGDGNRGSYGEDCGRLITYRMFAPDMIEGRAMRSKVATNEGCE